MKMNQKRRTPQDKFLPLLFLNTPAIPVIQKHSPNFPKNPTVRKINTDRLLPRGLKGGARD